MQGHHFGQRVQGIAVGGPTMFCADRLAPTSANGQGAKVSLELQVTLEPIPPPADFVVIPVWQFRTIGGVAFFAVVGKDSVDGEVVNFRCYGP